MENDIETVCSPTSQRSTCKSRRVSTQEPDVQEICITGKGDFPVFILLSSRHISLFNSFFKIKDTGDFVVQEKIVYLQNYLITCLNFTPKEFCPTKKYSKKCEITGSFKNNTVATKICLLCAVRILLAKRLKDKQFRLRNLRKCTTRKKYPSFIPIRGIINTWETNVC